MEQPGKFDTSATDAEVALNKRVAAEKALEGVRQRPDKFDTASYDAKIARNKRLATEKVMASGQVISEAQPWSEVRRPEKFDSGLKDQLPKGPKNEGTWQKKEVTEATERMREENKIVDAKRYEKK